MNLKNFPKRLDSKTSCLRITVPENLDLALEGLIRKVLKEQPKMDDIYSFAADYFETLLKIRDKAGAKFTSAQLCPFHKDEDAHEMIKLAGTFSKPASEKPAGESFPLKVKNPVRKREILGKDQTKKNVRKSKDEKVMQNKRGKSDSFKKKQMLAKSGQEQGKKEEIKVESITSNEKILEKEIKKDESEEEFIASDPIKELVERELMEAKSNSKREEQMEKIPESSEDELTKNRNEEQKLVDDINVSREINDTNEALEEESNTSENNLTEKGEEERRNQIETSNGVKETEIKLKTDEIEYTSKKAAANIDIDEEKEGGEEVKNTKLQNLQAPSIEGGKDTEKSNKENEDKIIDIEQKTNKDLGETNTQNEVNISEAKIVNDKNSDMPNLQKQSKPQEEENEKKEEEIDQQTTEIEKTEKLEEVPPTENRKKSSEKDETEKDKNAFLRNETLEEYNVPNIDSNLKEKEEKNDRTSEESLFNNKSEKQENEEVGENQNQPERPENKVDTKEETKSSPETTAKEENYKTLDGNEEAEITVFATNLSYSKDDVAEAETVNDKDQIVQQEKMADKKVEPMTENKKIEEVPELSESETEKLKNSEDAFQVEQEFKIIEKAQEISTSESETMQNVPKNEDDSLSGKLTGNGKPENENISESEGGIKTDEIKSTQEKVKKADESISDNKTKLENTVLSDENIKPLEDKINELSSLSKIQSKDDNHIENSSPLQPSESSEQKEILASEKEENLLKKDRASANEDDQSDEKFSEQGDKVDDKSPFEENSQGTTVIPVGEIKQEAKTLENEQTAVETAAESDVTNKGNTVQEKIQQEESFTVVNVQNGSKTNNDGAEKTNAETKSGKSDKEREPDEELCSVIDSQQISHQQKSEKNNQEPELKAEIEDTKNNEEKVETDEITTVTDIPEQRKENNISSEEIKPEIKVERSQNTEDHPKLVEELCLVTDALHLHKGDAIDINRSEEVSKVEPDNARSKEVTEVKESFTDIANPHIITVEEVGKRKESNEKPQPSGEVQIKTIQMHYYDTLQVPKAVTKEYRVHSVATPPMNALLTVLSSFQPNSEPVHGLLNQEKPTEEMEDININASPSIELIENVTSNSFPAELKKADFFQPINDIKNTHPEVNGMTSYELELETQKSDSEDLLDLMTPTSGYSLNLSELSLQTVSGLFLDSEKRYSSLEKKSMGHATPNTSKTPDESDESKSVECKQEVEEIIHKTVIPSKAEAVPMPPRDAEELNEESNMEISQDLKEKKEGEPENESSETSSDSNGGKSLENNAPIIAVEVKTLIETQFLDDEEEDDEKCSEEHCGKEAKEGLRPDLEIKIKTTVEIPDEIMQFSEEKRELFDKGTQEQNNFTSTQNQDESQPEKAKEDSLSEQTSGREGSSGESESTSSAATEIKRTDSTKRNYSSSRSLLLTQSLDFGKKNPLMKTRSLSTFRHGVTDFEVWNTIEKELEEAATKIQSKFRGYKTRKKLQRENAVQITTEESSISTTPVEQEQRDECQQSTGEFHDSVVLSDHPR